MQNVNSCSFLGFEKFPKEAGIDLTCPPHPTPSTIAGKQEENGGPEGEGLLPGCEPFHI